MADTKTVAPKEGPRHPVLELADRDAGLDVGLPARPAGHRSQPRAGDAVERLPAPAPGADPEVGREAALHVVHGRVELLPVPGADVHRPAADVLLPADARVRLHRHRRPARARAARHHARDAPLGRARDGHHRVAAHVPRLHDRLVQAAARVQLVGRRDHAGADAAAVVHRLPAAVGSAGDLGDHGRLEHGARDAVPRPRRPGRAAAAARRRPADSRRRRRAVRAARRDVRRRRRAAAVLRAALRRPAARHRGADGGALLARAQGRRHFGPL